MAAVYAPQQAQPSQVAQGGGQSAQEDPLFAALQKYITTGPDATNITTKELQTLYDESLADAASKVYLEKFLIDQPDIPFSSNWQDKTAMSGIIKLTKTSLSFNLTASSVEVSTKGEAPGLNVSSETQVVGTMRYSSLDVLAPGAGTFSLSVSKLTVYINFYRNQTWIANFTAYPISFTKSPGPTTGTNTWS
ncbi:hypothetical protein MMC15_004665 [Xylographa vitiligo]|nr:hypothetical protein [Xylographa vitiligo]